MKFSASYEHTGGELSVIEYQQRSRAVSHSYDEGVRRIQIDFRLR